ncbi:hypothetical protein [Photobacterium leiognathi]|uniref:hypothetical protein n=1 Tax=Photobacterium leiognathi TaxID=553611 RepID=UPI002981BB0C|nr:hypothetical protein [Photobacterium leiognathi]
MTSIITTYNNGDILESLNLDAMTTYSDEQLTSGTEKAYSLVNKKVAEICKNESLEDMFTPNKSEPNTIKELDSFVQWMEDIRLAVRDELQNTQNNQRNNTLELITQLDIHASLSKTAVNKVRDYGELTNALPYLVNKLIDNCSITINRSMRYNVLEPTITTMFGTISVIFEQLHPNDTIKDCFFDVRSNDKRIKNGTYDHKKLCKALSGISA